MAKQENNTLNQVGFWALLSMTLGLAPFQPEPHILGKLRWLAGGAEGMGLMDYFDLLLHGFPFVFLGVAIVKFVLSKLSKTGGLKSQAE